MGKSVLFVCLGNICRSPTAEATMNHVISQAGASSQWVVDSCGTARYHIGGEPDERAQAMLRKHGLTTNHRGRQLCEEDFYKFDFIFGMDQENLRNIKAVMPADSKAQIGLLGELDPQGGKIIDDPYYGGDSGFEKVYQKCLRCCQAFYDKTG